MKKLTAVKVEKLWYQPIKSEGGKNPGALLGNRISDSEYPGLYLYISPLGAKSFRFDFRFPASAKGKRQCLTYGQYPVISLAEAREMHREAKRDLAAGINPAAKKQNAKRKALDTAENTYAKVAVLLYKIEEQKTDKKTGFPKSQAWKDNATRWNKLAIDAFGSKPIQNVTEDDVRAAYAELLERGNHFSAKRVRDRIVKVFDYAIKKKWFIGSNPARALEDEDEDDINVPGNKGNAYIKEHEIPEFVAAVENSKADLQTKRAAKLLLLTLVRKGELLGAKRSELDLNGGKWEIPAERMKTRQAHLVPLAKQVTELLQAQLATVKSGDYVFPSLTRPGKHAGLSTLNVFFDRIGFADRLSPHGLRTVASTWLNETGRFGGDVIELQLSHREKNKIRATYNKADHWKKRVEMMQFYADHIDALCAGTADNNVIQLQQKAA
jgi:integrase